MPAYCSNFSAYDVYRQWCIDTHRTPPTRDWWQNSCNQPREPARTLTDDEFDDEVEHQDGWAKR